MKHARHAAGALAAFAIGLPAVATVAAEGDWAAAELAPGTVVEARLIAATDAVGERAAIPAGLHVDLPEGWKTYWRSPGDAGLPPTLDWSGSTNLADVRFDWPAPHRFTLFGLETFGYADEVVFPLTLTPETPGAPMRLDARADLLVCSELCVPATMTLSLDLPAGPAVPDADAANLIDRFAAQVPGDGSAAGLAIEGVTAPRPDLLRVTAAAREPFDRPDLMVEAPDGWAFGPPAIDVHDGGRLVADVPVLQAPEDGASLDGVPVTLTLVDGARAMERATAVGALVPADTGAPAGALLGMLGIAVLGGLILNLMPCVLPVLSLKLLSVVGQGGRSPARIRLGFLASAAGILASFMVLAGAAVAVKQAGGAVGWGIQFQQPLFVVAMVVVLTLFACNLLGLFEIRLPSAVADRAGRAGGDRGLGGDFATGAFATLLATPCSAPFLGTAVGFALARGPAEILAIFAALGLGLALPYLIVAAVPGLAARLPKPGRWMATLKTLLSLALAAAAVWLIGVLAAQEGAAVAGLVAVLMVGIALALWARRRLGPGARLAGGAVAALLALAAIAVPLPFDGPAGGGAATAAAAGWTPFERARIDDLVAQGRTVFVDVTADWCITCQANKALVLDRGAVADRLHGGEIVPMRADWTRPSDAIATYLADHDRYGIPFNAVYGPGAPDGIVLPELLTEDAVLDALARATASG